MSILRQINRLRYIDYMIRRRATGNLNHFAKKNKLSKSGISLLLQEMKEMGFPIKYNRHLNSYYYEEDGEMIKTLYVRFEQVLSGDDMSKLKANGSNLCFSKDSTFELCDQ